MALKTCPECGHQISSSAPTCPSCGKVFKAPKTQREGLFLQGLNLGCAVVIVVVAVVVFGVIYGLSGLGKSSKATPSQPASIQRSKDEVVATFPKDGHTYVQIVSESSIGRDRPDQGAAVVVVLKKGELLRVIDRATGWVQIKGQYNDFWLPAADLKVLN